MDGSIVFGRLRQCTPYNTCFLGPTRVHNRNGISICSAFLLPFLHSSWLRLRQTVHILYNWTSPLQKLPLPMGDLDPHLKHCSLGPPDPSPQSKRHFHRFSRFCSVHSRASLYSAPFPQSCLFPWRLWTATNTWFLVLTHVLNPNGISIGLTTFAGSLL